MLMQNKIWEIGVLKILLLNLAQMVFEWELIGLNIDCCRCENLDKVEFIKEKKK